MTARRDYWVAATVRMTGAVYWHLATFRIQARSLPDARTAAIALIGDREYGEMAVLTDNAEPHVVPDEVASRR